jgi:four helix bundle protein
MRTHRELIAWQRAHEVVLGVHQYGVVHWSAPFGAALEQLRRASLSVELNIVEGFACGRGARCRHHLRIAFGSAAESVALLDLLVELGAPALEQLIALQKVANATRYLTLKLWQRTPGR